MSWGFRYREYVPVGMRKSQGRQYAATAAKKLGREPQPISITGRKIASTFWGEAWCDHLEGFSDFSNRLPRGRTYARNGSIVDLDITAGRVRAVVAGSEVYDVSVKITALARDKWKSVRSDCAASIHSLLDLLSGRLSEGVMRRLTDRSNGLFPGPREITMECSCPDWAVMCKHVAAVLYGVGARLDKRPELLFLLRNVDQNELVSDALSGGKLGSAFGEPSTDLAGEDLNALFGIELEPAAPASRTKRSRAGSRASVKTARPAAKASGTEKPAKVRKAATRKTASSTTATTKAAARTTAASKSTASKTAARTTAGSKATESKATESKAATSKQNGTAVVAKKKVRKSAALAGAAAKTSAATTRSQKKRPRN